MQGYRHNLKVVKKTLVAQSIAVELILPAIGTNNLFSKKSRRVANSEGEFRQKRYGLGSVWASFARTSLPAC